MAANNIIKVTDIDFDTIKTNLKGFLSSQSEFKDYDFEASTMQIVLNLLAYNTYYNSFYLNMVGNEMFLDSATQRSNVVSRAKMLGYIPSSYRGATATINLKFTPNDSPAFISVAKNTEFTTVVDGKTYTFVNPAADVIVADDSGIYQKEINIVEGKPLTFSYTVSSLNPVRYIIPNDRVDSRSIEVSVVTSTSNSTSTVYTQATNLTDVTGTSAVFFLQENETGKTELTFGDGVIGKPLVNGNIVNISYRVCNGTACNKISSFTVNSVIDGYSGGTATTVSAAVGGANTESIDSIKYNAPRVFESQNRAVTKEDYKRLITNNFSDVQSISVWGGEDNDPPTYGKVFISCKPQGGSLLSVTRKAEITDFLTPRKVLAIEPEIVDATYLYVEPIITVKYNPTLTTLTATQIINRLQTTIINYESDVLGKFDGRFIHSQFVEKLSNVNDAIVSIDVRNRVQKRFTPTANVSSTYTLPFNRALLNITGSVVLTITPSSHPGQGLTVSSSSFTYDGYTAYLDDDGFGHVRIYYLDATSRRIYLNRTAGTIDYDTGLLKLNSITIQSSTEIQVSVVPRVYDIETVRNQLLLIAGATIDLHDDLTGAVVGSTTSVNTEGGTSSIIETGIVNIVY